MCGVWGDELGTRVPCFWYYPKLLQPRWSSLLGHITDLHPTFVALAGGSTGAFTWRHKFIDTRIDTYLELGTYSDLPGMRESFIVD